MILKSFLFLHFKPYLRLTAHILKKQKGFKGFKGTSVIAILVWSLEITLTVPLK